MKVKFGYTFPVRDESFTSYHCWPNFENLEELYNAIGAAIKLGATKFDLEVENEARV